MDIVTKKLYYKTNQSNLLSKYALKKLQKAKSKHKIKPLLSSRKSIIENRNQTNNSIASPLAPIETNTPNDNLAVDYENNSYQLEELDYEETSDENFLVDDELSNVMDTISENDSLCDDDEEFPFPRNLCLYDQSSNQIHEAVQYDCFDYDEFFDCDGEMDQPENNAYKPQTLDELITTEGFSDIIKTPVNISALNLLFFILRFSTENNLSVSALSNLFTLINSMFKYPIFPESRYMIDKFFNGNPNASFHAICRNTECNTYLGKLETLDPLSECKVCGTIVGKIDHTSTNFYVLMDPTNAIINSIKSNENYYDYVINQRNHNVGHYEDIYDGECYQKFVASLPHQNRNQYVTVTFNSDGAAPFKSSPLSVWPIYLMINELPVQERFKNIIPCALWFNRKKPPMEIFLKSFVEMMNNLCNEGIPCVIKGKKLDLKIYALLSCVDTVARAPMQGLTQFNGKYGCNWCLHPTMWAKGTKYPILNGIPLRTHKDTIKIMANLKQSRTWGVKSASPLVHMNSFNIIEGFCPDYMHCILAGVGKQITKYFINSNNIELYQGYLDNMKFPHQICRISRPLADLRYWKCREWENWILYASLPIFSLTLSQEMIEYWALLVESLYILLTNDITIADLDRVDEMLHLFVYLTEKNFKKKAMTYNVHQLLHISTSVKNWGPLWSHSAFAFESGNHNLLQAIHSGRGIISQILRFININQCAAKIEKKIFSENDYPMTDFCINRFQTGVKNSFKLSEKKYIMTDGGLNAEKEIRNILKEILTNKLGSLFSGKGNKGKEDFQKTEMFSLITEVILEQHKTYKKSKIFSTVSNWFKFRPFQKKKETLNVTKSRNKKARFEREDSETDD
ncbi:hypothetical protein TKK_0019062 [Trichogramma kaykai]